MVVDLYLFSLREAGKGFLLSLRASNRYAPSYLDSLETALGLLCSYAEEQHWPPARDITTSHIEEYLVYLQTRPRWFGERGSGKPRPVSQGHIETQYRRIRRFFEWLVGRGHIDRNPFELIPHPHVDERVVPTVSEREAHLLLTLVDPKRQTTRSGRFLALRNRAALLLLLDTPGRRNEIAMLRLEDVDLDAGLIRVMGKGRRERAMPLGSAVLESLWEYIQARAATSVRHGFLWVDDGGKPMSAVWLYLMLKRLGERAGVSNLHTHRFRHTYAMAALRGGMFERVLEVIGGWRRIPETYFRTLRTEDAVEEHRRISPADKLQESQRAGIGRGRASKARGRL